MLNRPKSALRLGWKNCRDSISPAKAASRRRRVQLLDQVEPGQGQRGEEQGVCEQAGPVGEQLATGVGTADQQCEHAAAADDHGNRSLDQESRRQQQAGAAQPRPARALAPDQQQPEGAGRQGGDRDVEHEAARLGGQPEHPEQDQRGDRAGRPLAAQTAADGGGGDDQQPAEETTSIRALTSEAPNSS